MNWNTFLLWTSGFYLLYYFGNFCFDLLRQGKTKTGSIGHQVLTFSEDVQPQNMSGKSSIGGTVKPAKKQRLSDQDIKELAVMPASGLSFSGGVRLQELVGLIKSDAIQLTKAIPY